MAHGKRTARATMWAVLVCSSLCARSAAAQPLVRVQAGTQVVLHGAHGEHGIEVSGALIDDLGAPLRERALTLEIAREGAVEPEQRIGMRSGEGGSFRASQSLKPGVYRLRVRFDGDSHHGPSEAERIVDSARADVRLAFIEPRALRVDLDQAQHRVSVRASSVRGGAGLPVTVADERGDVLAGGITGPDGVFAASLPASALGDPGSGKLVASGEADALRSAARAEIAVLRWRDTRLALDARIDVERDRLIIDGELRDSRAPLPGKAVGLFDDDDHLATVLTDDQGRFRLERERPGQYDETDGALALQARFDSDAAWMGSSRSRIVEIALAPSAPPSPLWLLVPLALCALLVWLLERRAPSQDASSAVLPSAGIGIHPARGRTRGRPELRDIAGIVRDATSAEPLAGAAIALRARDGAAQPVDIETDADGRFRSPELDAGEWMLEISAPGYLALTAGFSIAHRGEWSDVQVQLQSLRAAAVAAYKPAALRMLPAAELWQRWTARETLDHAQRNGRATQAFERLTEHVERAAYARTPPDAEDVAQVEQSAREALARFPNVPSQPGDRGLLRAAFPHRR